MYVKSMVVTAGKVEDLVNVVQGWWTKHPDGVTRFARMGNRLSKNIKLREGEGLKSVKAKVQSELMINGERENIELTYEMPEWMDVDGSVKHVPIHIRSDDDMDMFLAMKVELHELKFYVVPLPKLMTLQMDEYEVVPVMNEFAFAEVMSKKERQKELLRREGKRRIDEMLGGGDVEGGEVQLSQKRPEAGESSGSMSLSLRTDEYLSGKYGSLTDAFRHYQSMSEAMKMSRASPKSVLPEPEQVGGDEAAEEPQVTRNQIKEFGKKCLWTVCS